MLEVLEAFDYLQGGWGEKPDNPQTQLLFREPEFQAALCQVIGSPLFGMLSLKQDETKKHVAAHIAKITYERRMEKSLLLQHLVMQALFKHKVRRYSGSATDNGADAITPRPTPGHSASKKNKKSSQQDSNTFVNALNAYNQRINDLIDSIRARELLLISAVDAYSLQEQVRDRLMIGLSDWIHRVEENGMSAGTLEGNLQTLLVQAGITEIIKSGIFMHALAVRAQYNALSQLMLDRQALIAGASDDVRQGAKEIYKEDLGAQEHSQSIPQLVFGKEVAEALDGFKGRAEEVDDSEEKGTESKLPNPFSMEPNPFD
ncbi:MAG: hypothetical protein JXR42_00465 [Gammaproteobacteria bacterium]|nr:hypothetical protein [Gammaproteobacteria bacterium]